MRNTASLKHVPRRYFAALFIALAGQLLFWPQAQGLRPPRSGLGMAPPPAVARVISFGDDQLFYRAAGLTLQNAGDWAGTLTPLAAYDYTRLIGWLELAAQMDRRSQYAPMLAGFYFGQSKNPEQVRLIIGHLRRLAAQNPQRHWRWLAHGVYLARYKVKDAALALELARQLAALPATNKPVWTRELPAFVLAEAGERQAARDILEAILASTPDLHPSEQTFIRNYIDKRLSNSAE